MKATIVAALFALSLPAGSYAASAPAGDQQDTPRFHTPDATNGSKLAAVPEAGALILGLIGAMMLLRRRRS